MKSLLWLFVWGFWFGLGFAIANDTVRMIIGTIQLLIQWKLNAH